MIRQQILNSPPHVCAAILTHYHKEAVSNIIQSTSSLIKAPAVMIEYD